MPTYKILRFYKDERKDREVIKTGLTLEQAQQHCDDPESSSQTCKQPENKSHTKKHGDWFDGYTKEES